MEKNDYVIVVFVRGDEQTPPYRYYAIAKGVSKGFLPTGREIISLKEVISGVEHTYVVGKQVIKPSKSTWVERIYLLKKGMTLEQECEEMQDIMSAHENSSLNGGRSKKIHRVKGN